MDSLSFYVPNLSNDLPVSIKTVVNGEILESSDIDSLLTTQGIDRLKHTKVKPTKLSNMRVFYSRYEFYIEAITEGIDITNRPAILGIYGNIRTGCLDRNIETWLGLIKKFSRKVERPLQEEQISILYSSLSDISHRCQLRRTFSDFLGFALALILPILMGWILHYIPEHYTSKYSSILTSPYLISINNCLLILILKRR